MKLDIEQQAEVERIFDEAIQRYGSDHLAAAYSVEDELRNLEAGGHQWAGSVLDAAMHAGIVQRVKARAKRAAVHVPFAGKSPAIPARYSRRLADGTRQLALWIDVPLDALADIIAGLQVQASILDQRATQMRLGLELARKHGVATARDGFLAEGIDIDEVAA